MISYMSVLEFIMNPSNTFPCNFSQIDMLYQGPPVIHYELFLYISYCNCSCVSIIHNIPTRCNIVFITKVVIIYWCVVFKLSTSIIFSFPQLLHLIAIFCFVFFSTPPGLYQHLILNIENTFNNDGKRFIILYPVCIELHYI